MAFLATLPEDGYRCGVLLGQEVEVQVEPGSGHQPKPGVLTQAHCEAPRQSQKEELENMTQKTSKRVIM